MADAYYEGFGVEKNYFEAFHLYKKCSEDENSDAQNMVGLMLEYGEGVAQNFKQALNGIDSRKPKYLCSI